MKAYLLPICIIVCLVFSSCKKEQFITDSSANINVSVDSILFDTVFTTLGNATKRFKIYNPHSQNIRITRAYIESGSSSEFRLNIDGISGSTINNIDILPGDSLFGFVQVTVDPNNSASPVLISDNIIFETNTVVKKIALTAVGQDVIIHRPTIFPTNGESPYSLINTSTEWNSTKPHLIFGTAVVNADSCLIIKAGTKIFMNKDAVLAVWERGTLKIQGEKNNEVKVQGARLEEDYQDIPGQWGKLWLKQGSKNNVINWAIIKNGSIGIQIDSLGSAEAPLLSLSNSIIHSMSSSAIYGIEAHLKAKNCLFYNCGIYLTALTSGGNINFNHCTFVNYWNNSIRTTPSVYLNNYRLEGATYFVKNFDSAHFQNCIIDGAFSNELQLDFDENGGTTNYSFKNSMLKTTLTTSDNIPFFESIIKNKAPEFTNPSMFDYQLSENSPAIDKGVGATLTTDLNNLTRPNPNTSLPDIGAFEFYTAD